MPSPAAAWWRCDCGGGGLLESGVRSTRFRGIRQFLSGKRGIAHEFSCWKRAEIDDSILDDPPNRLASGNRFVSAQFRFRASKHNCFRVSPSHLAKQGVTILSKSKRTSVPRPFSSLFSAFSSRLKFEVN